MNVAASMLDALDSQLIGKRPCRLSPANYGDTKSYRQDLKKRNGDYADAKDALRRARRAVAQGTLTVEDIRDASRAVWMGRLSFEESPNVPGHWEYCPVRYYPLEVYDCIVVVLDCAILSARGRVLKA